jgi:hypothetical protein
MLRLSPEVGKCELQWVGESNPNRMLLAERMKIKVLVFVVENPADAAWVDPVHISLPVKRPVPGCRTQEYPIRGGVAQLLRGGGRAAGQFPNPWPCQAACLLPA